MQTRRRVLAAACTTSLLVAGCSTLSDHVPTTAVHNSPSATGPAATGAATPSGTLSTAPKPPEPAAPQWKPCAGSEDLQGLQCAQVQVPMDYSKPEGAKVSLAISMFKHTGSTARGVMLSNPGGPGLAGRGMALIIGESGVAEGYDIIGVDPRGVGDSKPSYACTDTSQPTRTIPAGDVDINGWRTATAKLAASCGSTREAKTLLDNASTTVQATDLESVRMALGAPQVAYWGNSYGTYLGQMYVSMYPTSVSRMLLDSVVDPKVDWASMGFTQARAMEKSLGGFYEFLAQNDAKYHLGTTASQARVKVEATRNSLVTKPIGKVGIDKFNTALVTAAYGVGMWGIIGQGLDQLINHRKDSLFDFDTGQSSEARYGYLGVMCGQAAWPSFDSFVKQAKDNFNQAPTNTWMDTWFAAPCTMWPVSPRPQPSIVATTSAPILLISETLDAATPYSGALAARRLFPSSVLVEGKDGVTHSSSLGAGPCLTGLIEKFWQSGQLPPRVSGDRSDSQCPAMQPKV